MDVSGLETLLECMPLVHVGRAFRMAIGLIALLMLVVVIRAPWAWVLLVVGLAVYPVSAGLAYLQFARSGFRSGPPDRSGDSGLVLMAVSLALVVSDSTVLSSLLVLVFAIFMSGRSTGEWLAVVARRQRTGFRGAVGAAWRLDRAANERAWAIWGGKP